MITYDSQIEEVTQCIFSTMLSSEIFRVESQLSYLEADIMATIQISGEFTGSLVLEMSHDSARDWAANMLSMSPEDITEGDQRDMAAELANMIGGNLKAVLPGPSYLSLPTVVDGSPASFEVYGAMLLDDVEFAGEGGRLRVRFFTKSSL